MALNVDGTPSPPFARPTPTATQTGKRLMAALAGSNWWTSLSLSVLGGALLVETTSSGVEAYTAAMLRVSTRCRPLFFPG